jgi:hypothetical protein
MNDYNNRGILFKNLRKWRPNHPDFTGEATIDGRKFKLAGWVKAGKRGEFYSLAFTQEQSQSEEIPASESAEPREAGCETNDIPF